jgi:formylglycine-generating enzyme required for sulfatase activity
MTTGFLAVLRAPLQALPFVLATLMAWPTMGQCPGDLTGNGVVDGSDLGPILAAWGTAGGEFGGDVNTDGIVNGADLAFVLSGWGTCPTPVVPAWATLLEQNPDPAIVTKATLRSAITATGLAWRVRDIRTGIEMVLIPPGSFQMGCSASQSYSCNSDEDPVHTVTLTSAFYLGRYEVTQAQWLAEMASNPSYFQNPSSDVPAAQIPNRPVEYVSWNMIQNFMFQTDMRLPTEAEWEYAYRAGTSTAYHGFTNYLNGTNVDALSGNIGWYSSNSNSQTRPVGGKAGNGFGLHDMSGNVWEWVNDRYSSSYYASSPSQDPAGPASGSSRVFRGGSWGSNSSYLRASYRYLNPPDNANYDLGCRAARSP